MKKLYIITLALLASQSITHANSIKDVTHKLFEKATVSVIKHTTSLHDGI